MTIIGLIVALVVVSLVIWLARTYFPEPARTIVTVALVLLVCVWLLTQSGLMPAGKVFGR